MLNNDGEDLFKSLNHLMTAYKNTEDTKFLSNLFEATEKLMRLDEIFKVNASQLAAYYATLASLDEYIPHYLTHKVEYIRKMAQAILDYFPEADDGDLEFIDETKLHNGNMQNNFFMI